MHPRYKRPASRQPFPAPRQPLTVRPPEVVASLVGLLLWFGLATNTRPGDVGQDDQYGAFTSISLLVGIVLVSRWPQRLPIAAAGFVGPTMVAAVFTAPRGDGDGLWVLIVPWLAGLGVLVLVGAALVATIEARLRRRH